MKGTRLWQNTGSPLISGSSRRHKPFWRDWLGAALVAFLAAFTVVLVAGRFLGVDLETVVRFAWLPVLPGALLGAIPGIWMAGKWGWMPRWPAGVVVGIFLSLLLAYLMPTYLLTRLNG